MLAFIHLNEVDDLFKLYGYDIGAKLDKKVDIDDEIKAEREITPEDYVLTEKDYFRVGCKTILNSERAALKVVK
jgi:hypothetical protein